MHNVYDKIFVIGFNKTATNTFHNLFQKNNLKSQHASKWKTNDFDCFSDNGNFNDYKNLDKKYNNVIFILNTRFLNKWLISRFKHGLRNKIKPNWAFPYTEEKCKEWIETRETYYLEILDYFSNCPEKLVIVNIEKDGWENYIASLLKFKVKQITPKNVHKTNKENRSHIKIIDLVNKTLKNLNYNKKHILIRDLTLLDKYLKLYKNYV